LANDDTGSPDTITNRGFPQSLQYYTLHPDSILAQNKIEKLSLNYLSTEVSSDPIF
jgi:hypothetical protein